MTKESIISLLKEYSNGYALEEEDFENFAEELAEKIAVRSDSYYYIEWLINDTYQVIQHGNMVYQGDELACKQYVDYQLT